MKINNDLYEKDEQIFSYQYPKGEKLKYSHGKIVEKEEKYLIYDIGSKRGSSGSPIILIKNSKVIGLNKGYMKNNSDNKINIGIRIESIINEINNRDEFKVNEELESKIKILNGDKKEKLIFKKQFSKLGLNTIIFIIEEKLNNTSFMFNNCSSLKEINFISIETDQITNMNSMFQLCNELEYLDLSNFITSNVTDMEYMFNECHKLKQIKGINNLILLKLII